MKNILVALFLFVAIACNQGPQAIDFGKDNCSFCKMTIMDEKFATECVSKKGKTFKFDDMHCMIHFIKNGGVWSNEIAKVYFSDFNEKGKWLGGDMAFILHSADLKSPMGGNYAAFSSEANRDEAMKQYNGEKTQWSQLLPKK